MLQAIAITLNGSCILLLTPQAINLNLQKLCLHVGGAQASFQHARPMAMNAGLHFQLREYTIKCLSSVGVLTQEGEAQAAQAAMPLWVICPARVQKEAVEADLEELQRPSNNSILSEIFRIMPRVIFLFNDWFAVREVHDRLDGAIDEALLLTALTLGFVSENNLEQLELLGDVVLEVFSIICETLNTKNRNMCMTIIEAAKERVCNQALYDISKDLIGRIRAIPPTEITKVSPFTNNQEPREQLLSVKDVADSFEAIIGAAWKSSPEFQDTFRAAGNLGMVIQGITSWRQIVDLAPPKGVLSDEAKNKLGALSKLMEPAEAFNEHNAFNFVLCSSGKPQDDLLKHMEHIGTALINLLQVEYDIGRYPDANPGLLTKLKMDGDTLIALCVDSGLSDFIPAGPGSYAITIYSELQQRAKSEYSNIVGRWWEYVEDEPPKTLQVFLRELVAAIFISDNFSLHGRVSEFFNKFFAPFLCAHVTPKAISSSGRQIAYSYIRAKGCNAFGFTDPQKIGSGTDAKWRCQGTCEAARYPGWADWAPNS
ncbi:hypothetical protein BOTBODRAFT_245633 [Botryobasidium botryosum FD-172 SS1]|uniref:RNase III domain-containing protein n=1 Tax=Botryobasidium botryosum (strain FD-172 SS1) TaxID=930990 RepID=A0A067LTN6_BOTB1|nr:hypothetical protein BOTBODRAFT_245633 [Botryobasidium botryosum FD-172 SS1]